MMYYLKWFHSSDRYGSSSLATEGVITQSLMKWKEELHNASNHNSSVWYKPWKTALQRIILMQVSPKHWTIQELHIVRAVV